MKWIVFLFASILFADKVITPKHQEDVENPWYTGPLLAPSSVTVPKGHIDYEPYLYIVANTGSYDSQGKVVEAKTSWANSFQPFIEIGLTTWMDVQFSPTVFYNYCNHQAHFGFGDLPVTVDFQLLSPNAINDWTPYIKLVLQETFPTGKYRNLDPKKLGTDITGAGTFLTTTGLVIGELFHLKGPCFLISRLSLQYNLPSPTHLKGFNVYGGGYGTDAHFFPAQNFEADLGLELTLTQNWVLACDFVGTWGGKTHFSGNPGRNRDGTPASLGKGSFVQYALAPALEYNWSENIGIIGGSWFTVAGRNSSRFWSVVIAFNYYK